MLWHHAYINTLKPVSLAIPGYLGHRKQMKLIFNIHVGIITAWYL